MNPSRGGFALGEKLFVEGAEVRSAEYLKRVAREFEAWHWRSRLGFNALAAASVLVGFLRFSCQEILSEGTRRKT